MAHVYYHCVSSARTFGGKPDDYAACHQFLDETKEAYADYRHRALRHHAQGIFEGERKFGMTITNSDGKEVPVRAILEGHILEDCGFIPTVADWLEHIQPQPWMARASMIKHQHRARRAHE